MLILLLQDDENDMKVDRMIITSNSSTQQVELWGAIISCYYEINYIICMFVCKLLFIILDILFIEELQFLEPLNSLIFQLEMMD